MKKRCGMDTIYAWLSLVMFVAVPSLIILISRRLEWHPQADEDEELEPRDTQTLLPAWIDGLEEALERLGKRD
jgi:hypothetical protein